MDVEIYYILYMYIVYKPKYINTAQTYSLQSIYCFTHI